MNRIRSFALTLAAMFLVNLTGCATLPVEKSLADNTQSLLSSQDQKDFNHYMNVSQDGKLINWRNDNENTSFELTATHTRVNDRGLACRDFELIIDKDYHRKKAVNATACRDNGNWQTEM